jgi:hypothetical protein
MYGFRSMRVATSRQVRTPVTAFRPFRVIQSAFRDDET